MFWSSMSGSSGTSAVVSLLLTLIITNIGTSASTLCPSLSFFPDVKVNCVSFPHTDHDDFYLQVYTKNMKDYDLVDDPDGFSVKIHFETPDPDVIVTPAASKFRPNQVVGIALDGVPIYSALVDIGVDGLAPDMSTGVSPVVLDECGGVYGPTGTEMDGSEPVVERYHYRAMPACILDTTGASLKRQRQTLDVHELVDAFTAEATSGRLGPQLLGYSLQGYPIFSPLNARGLLQDALDSCNGKFNLTSAEASTADVFSGDFAYSGATVQQPLASYGYYATPTFPYIVGCEGPGLYSTGELELPSVEMLHQRTGSKLATCPAGYMPTTVRAHDGGSGASAQYDNGCTPCPPGKYSLTTYTNNRPLCSMDCPKGHYCPAASVAPIKCPGGRYGSSKNLQTHLCSGVCSAGFYCPEGSVSPTAYPCGNESFYCPVGSAYRRQVLPGYYSTGDADVSVGVKESVERRTVNPSFPPIDYRHRTNQAICPIGHYCVRGLKHRCPAGRYGSTTGLVNSTCAALWEPQSASSYSTSATTGGSFISSLCPVGHYCPEGSVSPIICPAGRYGSSTGLMNSNCSGYCQAGHWCQAGSTSATQNKCPPGHYGDTEGLRTIDCNRNCEIVLESGGNEITTLTYTATALSAQARATDAKGPTLSLTISESIYCHPQQCAAGYFCPAASTSAMMHECGNGNVNVDTNATAYCPPGSSVPTRVSVGYYTVGAVHSKPGEMQSNLDLTTRVAQVECEPGYYCIDGVRLICPKGHYGSTAGLYSPTCSGECDPGYYCDEGSSTARQHSCKDASVYCPQGSYQPTLVPDGYYAVGRNDSAMATNSAIAQCPPGHFCVLGIIRPCEPGRYSASGSPSADCDGLCDAGYYCPVASTSPTELPCPAGRYGKHKGMINSDCTGSCDAGYYCPQNSTLPTEFECGMDTLFCPSGSGAPQTVTPGYYTTGGTARTRWDQSPCDITMHTGTPPSGPMRINKCPSRTA